MTYVKKETNFHYQIFKTCEKINLSLKAWLFTMWLYHHCYEVHHLYYEGNAFVNSKQKHLIYQLSKISMIRTCISLQARSEANVRVMEDQISDFKIRVEEHVRSVNDLTIIRNKLVSESSDSSHRLEDAENKVNFRILV